MINKILAVVFILLSFDASSNALSKDSPEIKQLIAMGYTIEKEDTSDSATVARLGSTKVAISKNSERLAITRYFIRERKLSALDEDKLLAIINKLNAAYTYQFYLSPGFLTASLFYFGDFDAKTFAIMLRHIDKVEMTFASNTEFFKLVNND